MSRCTWLSLVVGFAVGVAVLPGCGNAPDAGTGAGPAAAPADDPQLAAAKKASSDNLKQIMSAMWDTGFPAGIYAADGKTVGLSWRVALLPALKQEELYKEFKLDETWDSEHNKKLIARMPAVFAAPGKPADGTTYYRAFVGKDTVMPPPPPGAAGKNVPGVRIPNGMSDGTSNTAVIAEAAEPVVWTKPDGLAFDRQKPPPKLGGVFADGYHLALGDGSVHFFKRGVLTDEVLKAAITPSGGEVVELPGTAMPSNTGATKR